jgi:hypothetical protein
VRSLEELIDATAEAEGFSGVARVDRHGRTEDAAALVLDLEQERLVRLDDQRAVVHS